MTGLGREPWDGPSASAPGAAAGGSARTELPAEPVEHLAAGDGHWRREGRAAGMPRGALESRCRQGSQLRTHHCACRRFVCYRNRAPSHGTSRRGHKYSPRTCRAPDALKNRPERSCAGAVRAPEPHIILGYRDASSTPPSPLLLLATVVPPPPLEEPGSPLPTWHPTGRGLGLVLVLNTI